MNEERKLTNFIPINRQIFKHYLWNEKRSYSRFEAWLYLLKEARFENSKILDGGHLVEVKRGQIYVSIRFLSKAFGWTKKKIEVFLTLLESDNMIKKESDKGTGQSILTICNYDEYNILLEDWGTPRGHQGDAEGTKSNKENKDNIEEDVIKEWRDDFKIYLSEVTDAYEGIVKDIDFIKDRERYHPNIDIKLSLEKSFRDYWSTEAAWYKRKKSRTKKLDWVSTFKNSLDQKMNQVYKPRQDLFSQQPTSTKEKLCQWEIPKLGDKRKGSYEQYEADVKRNAPLQVNFLGYVE